MKGVFRAPAYKDRISDMESHMYSTPQTVRAYLESDPPKPFILCEYMHDMGNSLGGLGSYMDLLREYPLYQGGFIWDFIDQALFVRDEVTAVTCCAMAEILTTGRATMNSRETALSLPTARKNPPCRR